jgi:hypothetical protein
VKRRFKKRIPCNGCRTRFWKGVLIGGFCSTCRENFRKKIYKDLVHAANVGIMEDKRGRRK